MLTANVINLLNESSAHFKAAVDVLTHGRFEPMPPFECVDEPASEENWKRHFAAVCRQCLNQLEPDRN
jgi:hypothetical protein